jgi:hypothetical protein
MFFPVQLRVKLDSKWGTNFGVSYVHVLDVFLPCYYLTNHLKLSGLKQHPSLFELCTVSGILMRLAEWLCFGGPLWLI